MSFWLTYTACKTSYVHVGYCWVLNKHKTMTLRYNALQYGECYLPTYRTRTQPQQLTYIIESAFNGSKHPAPYPRSPEASRFLDKPLFIRSTAYDLPLNLVSKIISTFQFKGSLKHALIFHILHIHVGILWSVTVYPGTKSNKPLGTACGCIWRTNASMNTRKQSQMTWWYVTPTEVKLEAKS